MKKDDRKLADYIYRDCDDGDGEIVYVVVASVSWDDTEIIGVYKDWKEACRAARRRRMESGWDCFVEEWDVIGGEKQ